MKELLQKLFASIVAVSKNLKEDNVEEAINTLDWVASELEAEQAKIEGEGDQPAEAPAEAENIEKLKKEVEELKKRVDMYISAEDVKKLMEQIKELTGKVDTLTKANEELVKSNEELTKKVAEVEEIHKSAPSKQSLEKAGESNDPIEEKFKGVFA